MSQDFITEDERELIEAIRSQAPSGLYRLSDLFGEVWVLIRRKTGFGIRFKRCVEAGHFAGITVHAKTVENHQLYHVTNPADRQA